MLFDDTYMRYNYPEIGKAAVRVLEAAGFEPILVERKCCGRPLISKGLIQRAKANAAYNSAVGSLDCEASSERERNDRSSTTGLRCRG